MKTSNRRGAAHLFIVNNGLGNRRRFRRRPRTLALIASDWFNTRLFGGAGGFFLRAPESE